MKMIAAVGRNYEIGRGNELLALPLRLKTVQRAHHKRHSRYGQKDNGKS